MSSSPKKHPTTGSTDPRPSVRPYYLQPRVLLTWVVTLAWVGNISLLSTGAYSASVTGTLLAELLRALHMHLSPHAFATLHFLIRNAAHCTEYAIFSLLLFHSFDPRYPPYWSTRSALAAFAAAGFFSLMDEYHQSFVPGRTASLRDCAIDTIAALAALLLLYAAHRFSPHRRTGSRPAEPHPQHLAG